MAEIQNDFFFIYKKEFAALVLNQNFVPISFFCLEAITPTSSFSLFLSVPLFRRGWSANWTSGAVMCLTIQPPPSRLRAHRHTNARAHTRSPPRKMQNCEHTVMVKGRKEGEREGGRNGQRHGEREGEKGMWLNIRGQWWSYSIHTARGKHMHPCPCAILHSSWAECS